MWQVVLKREIGEDRVVYVTDSRQEARAKAHKLNRMSPASVIYKVEEVQDEVDHPRQTPRTE